MGQKCAQVWDFLLELTGLDPLELQAELNPVIKRLKLDPQNLEMSDIRRIMERYLKNTLEKSIKTGTEEESFVAPSNYTHN